MALLLKSLKEFFNSIVCAIGVADEAGVMIYVNPALVKMWGYSHENEILGRYIFEFWHGDGIYSTLKKLKIKGAAKGEDIGVKKNGLTFSVQFTANIINDRNKKLLFGSFIEITEYLSVKNSISDQIVKNFEKLIFPKLDRLKTQSSNNGKEVITLIEKDMDNITHSFGKRISRNEIGLSPREIEICDMIRNGLKNKEISKLLKIKFETVKSFRKRIRKKLKLKNEKINLRTFLQSLE